MKIKQTIRNIAVVAGILLLPVVAVVPTTSIYAQGGNNNCGVDTAIIKCDNTSGKTGTEATGLWSILSTVIKIMTAGVGVLALAGLVYGGILYSSAGGSPEQVKKARGVITNVVIGVVAFGGMFTLLNFIVPGGVFN